jgi:hypothetical protein
MKKKGKAENKTSKSSSAKKPVAAIEAPKAAITPQDHIRKKINNLSKKIEEIDKLNV